ncbi:type IV pilus modification protein PilV [Halomonas salicampi]|uniref:Type IV pilus modification protein PilV n=2 Tax=Vreelandella salicampi TaxID=1449798 RepID=A0A7Z0RUG8_9GAMM|nr:type IV pilus modification protein PilV [Halomonas salicampi]
MLRQRGFSLIEALIALLVLSLGLVGVAAMQLKALQSATAGYQRSVVTLAAVDAQERFWAALATQNCSNIKPQAALPSEDESIEKQWKDWWRADNASNPLRNVDWDASGIVSPPDSCDFTITIDLGDGPGDIDNDVFTYTFRLPNISGS